MDGSTLLFVVPCWLVGGLMICCLVLFRLELCSSRQSFTVSLFLACADSQLTGEKNPTNRTSGLLMITITIFVVDINFLTSVDDMDDCGEKHLLINQFING